MKNGFQEKETFTENGVELKYFKQTSDGGI